MPNTGDAPSGSTEQQRAATIIAHTARELARIAERSGLDVLASILNLARAEAELRMRGAEPEPPGK